MLSFCGDPLKEQGQYNVIQASIHTIQMLIIHSKKATGKCINNILTTKVLSKDSYPIFGREMVSTVKMGHIQPIIFSFPNFISHPNDKTVQNI